MTDLPNQVRWQLWIVAFGFFMQALDTTIVNTALPSMAQSLGESPLHMHMVVVAYVLTVAVMLPASPPAAGWRIRAGGATSSSARLCSLPWDRCSAPRPAPSMGW